MISVIRARFREDFTGFHELAEQSEEAKSASGASASGQTSRLRSGGRQLPFQTSFSLTWLIHRIFPKAMSKATTASDASLAGVE